MGKKDAYWSQKDRILRFLKKGVSIRTISIIMEVPLSDLLDELTSNKKIALPEKFVAIELKADPPGSDSNESTKKKGTEKGQSRMAGP